MCKISIIVPVYNAERFIKQTIESILQQTYKNFELICVNDASTDNSMLILETMARQDKRIIIINNVNCGVSESRNIGLGVAKGQYIMFVDAVVWIEKCTCVEALSEIKKCANFITKTNIEDGIAYALRRLAFNE